MLCWTPSIRRNESNLQVNVTEMEEGKMKEHILLDKTYVYEDIPKDLKPQGCSYDRVSGLWRVDSTGEVMMVGNYAQRPETKKCDVETGEDQKGE